jgi:hypothetical protein
VVLLQALTFDCTSYLNRKEMKIPSVPESMLVVSTMLKSLGNLGFEPAINRSNKNK